MSTQTRAEDYLPDGIHGQRSCCYYLDGLMIHPQIVIKDQKGVPVELTYNESTNSYSHTLEKNYLTSDQRKAFEDSSEIYGRYMIKNIKKSELGNYFVDESYNDITKANVDWMQSFTKYEFGNTLITEYYGYTPSYCSARIDRSLFVTRKNGTVKEYKISSTFFLEKRSDGWKVVKMTNENMSEIITEVRITFYSDDEIVQNETINANVHELYFPIIDSTEGKTFSGWFTKSLNDKGETVMTLTFKPDENGKVTLPDDYTLKPMKLYAVFE